MSNKASAGTEYWKHQHWDRFLESFPSTYTIWYNSNDSKYYGESNCIELADVAPDPSAITVIAAVIDALPTNGLGGKTGTIFFRNGIYTLTNTITIPNWSHITFIGESFESAYELSWLCPSTPNAFNSGVVFDFTQAGTIITTAKVSSPPAGHSGLTVFLGLENIQLRASTANAVTCVDGDGIFSANFRNVVCYYNLANKNWQINTPTASSYGFKLPNNLNERIVFTHVAVYGFETGYQFGCDHINGSAMEAAYCEYGIQWVASALINEISYFHALRCHYGIYYNNWDAQVNFSVLEIEYNGIMPWADAFGFKFGGSPNGQNTIIVALLDDNAAPYSRYVAGGNSYLNILKDGTSETTHFGPNMALGKVIDNHATDNSAIFIVGGGTRANVSAIGQDASDILYIWAHDILRFFTQNTTYINEIRDGDFYSPTASHGIQCRTPDNAHIYRIRVDNAGNVVTDLVS